ncbi:hypothetical protein RJ55_07377 [Drechmeria coniospora]|nr:hypothetical protein RJ55_07377 [Drechmeria coniospora]
MRAGAHLIALVGLASLSRAVIPYLGIAIPGIDFGCDIDGSCPSKAKLVPLKAYRGGDGEGQMKHFVEDDGLNMFRLPITWQYAVKGKRGRKLDAVQFGVYDRLMQACLDTGAYCIIDLHNFARYDGAIIGQSGPDGITDDHFTALWAEMATKYAADERVVFGLMNEPHDVDIEIWAQTCQKAVTAIREAGAEKHLILLPGSNFSSAETFVSGGSAKCLAAITNPDGSTDGLLMDLHKYLDINNSGSFRECTTDNVAAFQSVATWLRKNKRQAIVSETGASTDPTCMTKFCAQNQFIADNTDVFVGFVGWAAGSFDSTYTLTLTPIANNGSYKDNKLMKKCIIDVFGPTPAKTIPSPTADSLVTPTRQILHETAQEVGSPLPSATDSESDNAASSRRFGSPRGPLALPILVALIHAIWLMC